MASKKKCACGADIKKSSTQCVKCYRAGNARQEKICPSCGRKPIQGRSKTCKDCQQYGITPEVKEQRATEAAKRYKKLYKQAIKKTAEVERIRSLIETSIIAFPSLPPSAFKRTRTRPTSPSGVEVPCLALGDLHIGEDVSENETYGMNRYNFQVFQQRLEFLEDRVVDILTVHQKPSWPHVVVLGVGDFVSGIIHDELEKAGAQHIVDQTYIGALVVALFLRRLAFRLGVPVHYHGVTGNHGRIKQKKEAKQYYKNFDYLFNAIMAAALIREPNVKVNVPQSLFTVIEIGGQRIVLSHGHELPPSPMGLPAYSINRTSAAYQEFLAFINEKRYDYWVLGHFHRNIEIDNAIVNGSMIGMNEYSIGRAFKPVRPFQKLFGFNQHGQTFEYKLWLDRAPKSTQVYCFEHDMGTDEALGAFEEGLHP